MSNNPRVMAQKFRIWQYASEQEWNVTAGEIAAHLGDMTAQQVGVIVRVAGWSDRIATRKSVPPSEFYSPAAIIHRRVAAAIYNEVTRAGATGLAR